MSKIFISAGDPSGDIHSARLISALKEINPELEFIGIGGPEMAKVGFQSIVDIEEISVVGFWEVIKKYGFFTNLLKKSAEIIASDEITAFIPVDYPGFNIRLAASAKAANKKVIYYIAPQLWAWGKQRAKKLQGTIDLLLVVLPFEKEYFEKFGLRTEFIGHPLLDDPFFDKINENRDKIISFFPGSRKQEIEKHLPLYSDTASILENKLPDYEFYISGARTLPKELFRRFLINDRRRFSQGSRELMGRSAAAVIKTGTSNLEAALAGLPYAMAYKAGFINYLIGKNLINLDYVSLPNILLNKAIIREFIQTDASPNNIANEIIKIVNDNKYRLSMLNDFEEVKIILGEKGAAKRAAEIIVNEL